MRFRLAACRIDLDRGEVRRGEEVLPLTATEVALLAYLAKNAGKSCTREALLRDVWGYREGLRTRAVDFAVHRLRRKIEADPSAPLHLVAAPGRGYRLDGVVAEHEGAPSSAAAPPPAIPGHGLFGRAELVAALAAWRAGPPAALALVGPGGIGKTRLARLLGGVFVDLTAATRDDGVGRLVASTLGVPPDAIWRAARDLPLLVLDNAEHVASGVDTLVATAGAPPPCHVLVTSRIVPANTAAWEVPPLLAPDSVALLRARAPAPLADTDEALGALASSLGHLPLALEHAAARLGVIGVDALRRRVEAGAIGLVSARAVLEPRHASLHALLEWSWTLLAAPERQVLLRALAFATPFDFDGAEAVTGLDAVAVADALADLLRHHWLLRTSEGRFAFSPPVRAWLDTVDAEERRAGERAHIRWAADAPLPETLIALDRATDPEDVLRLAHALPAERMGPDEPIRRRAARIDRAVALAPEDARLRWARGLALALGGLRAEAAADLEAAVELGARSGDQKTRGLALGGLGNLAAYMGDPALAEARYAASVAALDEAGTPYDAVVFLANLGGVLMHRGDLARAEATLTDALARLSPLPANRGRAHTNLGNLYALRGKAALAEDHYARAEALFREAGDRMCLGQLLGNRALRRLETGALDEAAAMAEEALRLHRALGNLRSEGFVWLTMGGVALERGRPDALDALLRARAAFDEVADRRTAGWAAWMLGRARALLGAGGAVEALREGIAVLRGVGDVEGLARATSTLALFEPVDRPAALDEIGAGMWAVVNGAPPTADLLARSHDLRMQARLAASRGYVASR